MHTLIRVNASSEIGMGHLMRCLALAQGLVERHMQVTFIVDTTTLGYCQARHDWVGQCTVLPQGVTSEDEVAWIKAQANATQADVLVIDGYQFDASYRQGLRGSGMLVVAFDDTAQTHPLSADIIINGAAGAAELGYHHREPEATLCIGEQYRVMRSEFCPPPHIDWPQRQGLLIAMGGSDPKGLTVPLLSALAEEGHREPVRVVTGAAYPHLDALQRLVPTLPFAVQHIHDCQTMADAFSHASLCVSAAGGSQFELQACGTPSVLITVADNQVGATQGAAQQGWCHWVDGRESIDCVAVSRTIMTLLNAPDTLQQMSQKAYSSADTQGTARVIDAIHQRLYQREQP
ncbi:UDP-2,4-diacetamido-2,4,6-trideoxy-beta-L-altropyranose hydrolase [Aestuariibacter halophilus]|uniref:UDP-2,4-diacetamido-2,4, 6-trideoxy-beta-L-altropyranose hydrolase n=1 Tax=Fluctibacter halophilus TaxID=226011 RepID=A0ABS8G3T1_9ALTE|nr:UDP-2,4-diacetamido-2,4,6-trideoxy-beta-L-altropyranose hydrolase [Aestuariibacter halophilus]MCC2615108.1 UDP-2,4-diacetamido-2,4,6-trideoxy-beta-L-altropyranose hydrolase [Aestuariibacter halophilus]